MSHDVGEILKDNPFFCDLDADGLMKITEIVNIGRFRKNQILFVEGMPANALYFVLNGKVKVYRSAQDGRELVLHLLKPGDPVAVVPFFDRGPYPATAEVVEDGELAYLLDRDWDRLMTQNPDILMKIVKVLARRLRHAQEQIASLGLRDAQSRVASLLLQLAHQHGTEVQKGIQIELDLTRQDLGNFIGVSRETTTRILNHFKRDKVISIRGSIITILDEDQLGSRRNL